MMDDQLEYRLRRLRDTSALCRRLMDGLLPVSVVGELQSIADEDDREITRLERDCRGKRCCPCELAGTCPPIE